MENKQGLGIKVFYYYLSKNIFLGIIALIVATIVASFKTTLIMKVAFVFSLDTASKVVGGLITLLFIFALFLLIINILMSWLKYKSCFFIVGDNTFTIKTGILNKKENSIPYQQIQAMNIEQTFSQRMMGICGLHILTAGNDNNDKEGEAGANFNIMDINVAKNLKEAVLAKTNIRN